MMTQENSKRIAAARKAAEHYRGTPMLDHEELQESLVDLVTDILHLLEAEGIDTRRVLRLAQLHHREEGEGSYQGWRNYPTWAVQLWLRRENPTYDAFRALARSCRREAPTDARVREGIWTAEAATRFNLADRLKEAVQLGSPLNTASLYSDVLTAAFNYVAWEEIADAFLLDI